MDSAELSARITLRALPGVTDRVSNRLVAEHGSAVNALREPNQVLAAGARMVADASIRTRVRSAMRTIDRLGARVLASDSPDYPRRLVERLGASRPALLYAMGDIGIIDNAAIAIVGSRQMSEYGRAVAEDFGRELARAGYTILSGLASGVDTVAHEAALFEECDTIAVVGNGIDVTYPASNGKLRQRILQRGLLLSQFLPGERPRKQHFPERNLIMAALSEGVLVVEAGARSGAIITANHAAECGVDAMAVPGPIGRPQSVGANQLIRDGAVCVTSAAEVMELLHTADRANELIRQNARARRESLDADRTDDRSDSRNTWISEETRAVRAALDGAVLHLDEILEITGLGISDAVTALLELEMNGQVRHHPGVRYELRRP